jgi:hypothetical protein
MKPTQTQNPKLGAITYNQILAVLKEVAKKTVSVSEAAKAITESGVNYADFKTGQDVYIMAGPGAGYRGKLKEVNKGYANVTGNMGEFWFVPAVFLMHDENPPASNKSSGHSNTGNKLSNKLS